MSTVDRAQVVCPVFSYELSLLRPQVKHVCVFFVAFFRVVLSVFISGNGMSNDKALYLSFNMPLSCFQKKVLYPLSTVTCLQLKRTYITMYLSIFSWTSKASRESTWGMRDRREER